MTRRQHSEPSHSSRHSTATRLPIRGLAPLSLAIATLLAVTAVALAGEAGPSPSGQLHRLDWKVKPSTAGTQKRPRPATFEITAIHRTTTGVKPDAERRALLHFQKGYKLNYALFPKCDRTKLERRGPSACPKGSRVGTGSAMADATPVVSTPVRATITAFIGKRKNTYLIYAVPQLGLPVILEGTYRNVPSGPYGYSLDVSIPLVATLLGQPPATIVFFRITTGAKTTIKRKTKIGGKRVTRKATVSLFENPRFCTGSWQFAIEFTYENGEQLTPTDSVPCTK
jgi:hypothetical protein